MKTRFHRNLWLLSFASLFTDMSSHILFPLLPLFLTSVLGATPAVVGLIEGAADTFSAWLKGFAGAWSDRFGQRRPFVLAGYGVSAFTKLVFVFASTWPLVLFARVTERIGKGLRSAPRDALIADECPPDERGSAFGFQRAMDATGGVIGAILAWYLLGRFSFQQIFLFAVIPAFVAVFVVWPVHEAQTIPSNQSKNKVRGFRQLPSALKWAILACGIFAFAQFGVAFFILKANEHGFSHRDAILAYVFFNLANALIAQPAGKLSDRIGRMPVLIAGYLGFALSCFIAVLANTWIFLALSFLICGAAMALVDAVQRAWIADLSPRDLRATAMGGYHATIALVSLPGAWIAGLLWQNISPSATFIWGMSITALAAIILFRAHQLTSVTRERSN